MSPIAKTQLRALRSNAASFRDHVRTEAGRAGFDHIQEMIEIELKRRENLALFENVAPGAYLRGASLKALEDSLDDPVDPIPLRFAALCLSCLADQDPNPRRRQMDIIAAAVCFALSGSPENAGFLLEEHGVDLDELPLRVRFALATLVPEMRVQLMTGFPTSSPEFRLLNMIEHNANHFRIRDLLEEISYQQTTSPRDVLELFMFRLANRRVERHAYRSSFDQFSQAELQADPKLRQRQRPQ